MTRAVMSDCSNQRIRDLLANSQKILLASHVRPDGDAVGSLLGLGLGLINSGKEVQMFLENGVPSGFKHLPGSDLITKVVTINPDLTIFVDCSELTRIGRTVEQNQPDINIDHHVTNTLYAACNFIDPDAVATASIIAENYEEWGLQLDKSIASALLSGIITDTLGFRTANMNPKTMRLSANLMEHGADIFNLYAQGYIFKSFEAVKYWGIGLSKLQKNGRLVWTKLTLEDRKSASYPGNDDADLINVLSSLSNTDVAVLMVEQNDGRVKISWRAQPGLDISNLALQYGGGGHPAASGAELFGTIDEVEQKVIRDTLLYLEQILQG